MKPDQSVEQLLLLQSRAGSVVRGHEFHYATLIERGDDAPLADLTDGDGRTLGACGGRRDRVTGTFFHVIAQA